MRCEFTRSPDSVIKMKNRQINIFDVEGENIDQLVVEEFGEEWLKFSDPDEELITKGGESYFDILDNTMVNDKTYALDIGCGTGRWTKYLSSRAGFIEAVDPSKAIFAANKLLGDIENVRLSQASIETLPFPDETFDFVMSVGVLHHIPDTDKALNDCVKKVKKGGYFFVYLYYDLDNRGFFYKALFKLSDSIRGVVSWLPGKLKRMACDFLAVIFYMPFVLSGRLLYFSGFKKIARKMPLSNYQNYSFLTIRNDALDRFGTRLEQRFSASQINEMMENAGLTEIVISPGMPYYHAVGKRR